MFQVALQGVAHHGRKPLPSPIAHAGRFVANGAATSGLSASPTLKRSGSSGNAPDGPTSATRAR